MIDEWISEGVPEELQMEAILNALAAWDLLESFKEAGEPYPMLIMGDQTAKLFNSFTFNNREEFAVARAEELKIVSMEDFAEHYMRWIVKQPCLALL